MNRLSKAWDRLSREMRTSFTFNTIKFAVSPRSLDYSTTQSPSIDLQKRIRVTSSTTRSSATLTSSKETIRVDPTLPYRNTSINVYDPNTAIDQVPIVIPRLEQHYYNTLVEDMMILTYDHHSPNASLDVMSKHPEWSTTLPKHHLKQMFSTPLEDLSTEPYSEFGSCTNLITKKHCKEVKKRRKVFKKTNPIDFTGMSLKELNSLSESSSDVQLFTPAHSWFPALKKIELRVISHAAIQNKTILYAALMTLSQITGVKALPLYAERAEANLRLREGMPIGAYVEVKETKKYEFLDKLVHTVLPRLREWKGISPKRTEQGHLSLKLSPSEMGYFPDTEPHFDMYPTMLETEIAFITNCRDGREDALLLSGFGIPIDESKLKKVEGKVDKDVDVYAKYKKETQVTKKDLGPIRGTLTKSKA